MSIFLIVFTIIAIALLICWMPLLGIGIYRLKKYGAKPGGIIMTLLGGIWGIGALVIFSLFLFVYFSLLSYEPTIFNPSEHDGPVGKIQFPLSSDINLYVSDNEGNVLVANGDGDSITLPIGEYYLSSCRFKKKDEKGNKWNLRIYPENQNLLSVTETKSPTLDIGPPVKIWIKSVKQGKDSFRFSLESKDKNGNRALLSSNSSGKTSFKILSLDQKVLKEGNFEYG